MLSYLTNGLPKCKNCMFYIPYGISKSYDLAKCGRFLNKDNQPIFAEIARLDDLKCSMNGVQFRCKSTHKINISVNFPPGV